MNALKKTLRLTYLLGVCLSVSFAETALAEKHEVFKGEAKENGVLVYVEHHDVTFDDSGKVLTAVTKYVDPAGKTMGILNSDFRHSLNLPEHIFRDERTKAQYGIRREGDKVILFSQDDGKPELTKELKEKSDNSGSSVLQVGCQGFNYYLRGKIDDLRQAKSLPVLFMVPGDLSTYKFVLEYVRENPDQSVDFRVKIDSWLLRIFAPTLEFRYDQKINRIVWYKGISNVKNDKRKTMNVTIDYSY